MSISADDYLLMLYLLACRHLAVGDSQATLSFAYRCGRATVSVVVRETLAAIIKVLLKYVSLPSTPTQWKEIASV